MDSDLFVDRPKKQGCQKTRGHGRRVVSEKAGCKNPSEEIVQKDGGQEQKPTGCLKDPEKAMPFPEIGQRLDFPFSRASIPQYSKFAGSCNGIFSPSLLLNILGWTPPSIYQSPD